MWCIACIVSQEISSLFFEQSKALSEMKKEHKKEIQVYNIFLVIQT